MTKADKLASNGRELVEPIETLIEGLYRSDVAIGTIVPVVCGPRIANVGRVASSRSFTQYDKPSSEW